MRGKDTDAEGAEPQEAMLSWSPAGVGWYCDACKTVVLDEDLRFLTKTVFEKSSEPGVQPTGYVNCCCSDEIVPEWGVSQLYVESRFVDHMHTKM